MRKSIAATLAGAMILTTASTAPAYASVTEDPTASDDLTTSVVTEETAGGNPAPSSVKPSPADKAKPRPATRSMQTNSATEFWGRPRPTKTGTVKNVTLVPGKVVANKITVTKAPATGAIEGTAEIKVGKRTLATDWVWNSSCDWTVKVDRPENKKAGKPRNRTQINLSNVRGSISVKNCERRFNLSLTGYRIGNKTASIKLSPIRGGFEGSKKFSKLVVGQTKYSSVTISVSTKNKYAQLEGDLTTNIGRFEAMGRISAPDGVYTQNIRLAGADLKFEKGGVQFKNFQFRSKSTFPQTGCASFTNAFDGSFVMKNKNYNIRGARMTIECGKVVIFEFKINVSHTDRASGVTKSATMALALTNKPGTTQDLQDPSLGETGGRIGTFSYHRGLFGFVNLEQSREFSKKYKNKRFKRNVRMGVVFGIALYTTNSKKDSWRAKIGAGGYFDADRVSGSFGCIYEKSTSTDFTCRGKLRLNPSWAGVYRAEWNGI